MRNSADSHGMSQHGKLTTSGVQHRLCACCGLMSSYVAFFLQGSLLVRAIHLQP